METAPNTQPATKTASHKRLLVDVRPISLQLIEGTDGGKIRVRGEFARANSATENKRLYSKNLLEREINRLGKGLTERRVLGELDHPSDGRTQLQRVSHVITKMGFEGDVLIGEAEPLDTAQGRNLKALLQSGVKIGVSSRGYGSVRPNDRGEDVVQEDYRLVTFDFVAEPADSNAYPEVFIEEKLHMADALMEMTLEELRASRPDLCESLTHEREQELAAEFARKIEAEATGTKVAAAMTLKDEFTREIIGSIARTKSEIREQLRAEFLADPSVAAAKTAIESIKYILRPFVLPEDAEQVVQGKEAEISGLKLKLSESDLRIQTLEDDVHSATKLAKEVGYRYFLETTLAGNADAELIKKLIGDVTAYASTDAIKAKIESATSDFAKKRAEEAVIHAEQEAKLVAEREKIAADAAKLAEAQEAADFRINKMEEALEKSLRLNKELGLKLYVEDRLRNHPQAGRIRPLFESSLPGTTGEIDEAIDKFRTPQKQPDEVESVRARVRKLTQGGDGPSPLSEETSAPKKAEDYNGLGLPLETLRGLSGIRD